MTLATDQGYTFFIFLIIGIIIGIIFDFFRIIRKTYKLKNNIIQIQDLIFWIISGIIVAYGIFKYSYGEIRAYLFLGIVLGIAMYILTISNKILEIGTKSLSIITEFFKRVIHIISIPFITIQKKIIKPGMFMCINISKTIKEMHSKLLKLIKNKMSKNKNKEKNTSKIEK